PPADVSAVPQAAMPPPREQPLLRPLRTYAFDPSRGHNLGNHIVIRVPYEPLQAGPIGARVAVIDYDVSNKCYYQAVDLDEPAILLGSGLEPRESDPRFHQQMVYAVVNETVRHFEQALGREVHWNGERQLKVHPHAMNEANAFYSAERKALLFGYFNAISGEVGESYPGQVIFTCLSHDIVAHETTHALVDGIRRYFMEPTNP